MINNEEGAQKETDKTPFGKYFHPDYSTLESDGLKDPADPKTAAGKPGPTKNPRTKHCSTCEKTLLVLVSICLLFIIVLFVLLLVQRFVFQLSLKCDSRACVKLSDEFQRNMNESADPCTDFYEYSCGNWLRNTHVPSDVKKWNIFSERLLENEKITRQILTEPIYKLENNSSSSVLKVRQFYRACLNKTESTNTDPEQILKLIGEVGSWTLTPGSLSGSWDRASWDLTDSLAKIFKLGVFPLFSVTYSDTLDNNTVRMYDFGQNGLTFNDETLYDERKKNESRETFTAYLVNLVNLMGEFNKAELRARAKKIFNFELELKKIQVPRSKLINVANLNNKQTFKTIDDSIGNKVHLHRLLLSVFNQSVDPGTTIVNETPDYFTKLSTLLENTPDDVIADYMVWHMVMKWSQFLTKPYLDVRLEFDKVVIGVQSRPEPSIHCVQLVNALFPYVITALFIERKHFTDRNKQEVTVMLENIRHAFVHLIKTNTWMDEETKRIAIDKAHKIKGRIAYPQIVLNQTALDLLHSNLTVTDDHFTNIGFYYLNLYRRTLRAIKQPEDKNKWSLKPTEVNAAYSAQTNSITLPVSILLDPFFNQEYPMSVNYGSIGMIMGHELTHAFDTKGSKFDANGNLKNWWSEESRLRFNNQTQCLVDQYDKFTIYGKHLSGRLTVGENIADNTGIETAMHAYHLWLKQHKNYDPVALLPGLKLTREQLFYLGFARLWCAHYTKSYAIRSLTTDVHTFSKYRIIGTLSNSKYFSKTWNCPMNSPMNPTSKCKVW